MRERDMNNKKREREINWERYIWIMREKKILGEKERELMREKNRECKR